MPEIEAYQSFLSSNGFKVDILNTFDLERIQSYQIEWHIMGLDDLPSSFNRLKIHEYSSLPIPPFAKLKTWLKKRINPTPDLRIFQTKTISQNLNFNDDVPSCIRGPGVSSNFLTTTSELDKPYDLVYLGAMEKVRKIGRFIEKIIDAWPNARVLLIGEAPLHLKERFESPNIHFTGRITYEEVPKYLKKASYGLNLIPDTHPFNIQPSYKLIDYCAAGLKVITSSYDWVEGFEKAHKARFFKLKKDGSNLHLSSLEQFPFITPDVSHLIWEKVLQESQLIPKLNNLLERKNIKF